MADKIIGKVTQIIGAVLDVKFSEGQLPELNDAVKITRSDGTELTIEVAQHLGDDTVRCIAMGPTDGLVRGMDAVSTGAPITAYHEAGHAILFHVLPDVGPVYTVSIIPTGVGAAGYTMPLPEKDEMFLTKGRMLQDIMVSLGGRIAEEIIF